jgi:hypothetical protein
LTCPTTIPPVNGLLVLSVLGLGLASCGESSIKESQRGVLTGEIRYVGGPPSPRGELVPKTGRVIVFTTSGRVLASQRVDRATHLHFRFILPPGRYGVNAGKRVRYHYPFNCRARKVQVRPGRVTTINVHEGCGIP